MSGVNKRTQKSKYKTGTCYYCGRERQEICKLCHSCRVYCGCKCFICDYCHSTHGERGMCRYCGQCKHAKMCECRHRPGALRSSGKLTLPYVKKLVNRLDRLIGLEVEISDWGTLPTRPSYTWPTKFAYTIDHDGSVVPSGLEMLITPLRGDAFVAAMCELTEEAARCGARVNETCGLHVHVDTREISYWELRRVLVLYEHFEEEIYRLLVQPGRDMAKSRHGYLFCSKFSTRFKRAILASERAGSTAKLKELFQHMVYGVKATDDPIARKEIYDTLKRQKYGGERNTTGFKARYMGLNIHSWFHRGTIEWRMKEGTLDLTELVCWSLFCGWFVDVAVRACDSYIIGSSEHTPRYKKLTLLEFIDETMPKYIGAWAAGRAGR